MIDIHPNLFAYIALLVWPLVALYLYSKLPISEATLWTVLGGYLLLPVGTEIKFEMLPAFNKLSIPNLAALVGCAVFARRLPKLFHGFGLPEVLILVFVISPFITSMLNNDPIRMDTRTLPGVGPYDALSAAVKQFIFIVPFFLGRQFLRSSKDNAEVLRVMVIAGLCYSLPMLFEVRMSPQLHIWIYGYSPQIGFSQLVRDGGFRPLVFLQNALITAFFAMTTTVAAAALWRTQTRILRLAPGMITGYLCFVLLLCKTASALVYCAVLVPMVRWVNPRLQLRVASILVILTLAYPILRVADLVPTTSIIEVARAVSVDRADSLKTRFDQEDRLLDYAWQRRWFGWGRFGRSRIHYAESGRDISITDGFWIITLGVFGLVGLAAQFGLLALGVFRAATALKFAQTMQDREYLAALALIVAIGMVDLLPNSSISPWTWLLVGALLGRAEALCTFAPQLGIESISKKSLMDSQTKVA